jgi:hypothetical protein
MILLSQDGAITPRFRSTRIRKNNDATGKKDMPEQSARGAEKIIDQKSNAEAGRIPAR